MILARSPLRITLGGGGTDLPSYYRDHGGFFVAAAIDLHVHAVLGTRLDARFRVRVEEEQQVEDAGAIRHPLVRECCRVMEFCGDHRELLTLSQVPGNTGLGSSGAFCCALLSAIAAATGRRLGRRERAELACEVEMGRLGRCTGKQDPYVSSFGGLHAYHVLRSGSVEVEPLRLDHRALRSLNESLVLAFIGARRRSADAILRRQPEALSNCSREHRQALSRIKRIGLQSRELIESGNTAAFGELMHEHWTWKKTLSDFVTTPRVDEAYAEARRAGAIGGKVVGAGGSGFLLLCVPPGRRRAVVDAVSRGGLVPVTVRLGVPGTRVGRFVPR